MSVRKSLVWSYGSQLATFLLTFGTSVVVARLLSPRDLGIYAMAFAVSGLIASFTTFQVGAYIVREQAFTRQTLRAGYTVNAGLAIAMSLVVVLISLIPGLFESDVRWVLRIVALNPLVGLFEFAPWAMAMRDGRFGLFSAMSLVRNVLNALATIAFAFAGFGAASLALGALVGYIGSVAGYAIRRPHDFVVLPTTRGLRPILVFGFQMLSISGVNQLAMRVSDLVLGKTQGVAALGLYARASNIYYQIATNVYGLATNVLFSKMSEELRNTGSLHRIYLRSLAILTAIVWPLLIGIAVLARPFIGHVYGDKWLEAATPLSLLMIAQFITLGVGMSWELFALRGETARQTRYEAARALVGTGAFAVGAMFSITGAAIGRVVEAAFGYILYRPHMDRLAGAGAGELERVYLRSAMLTVAAVTPSLLLMLWTDWSAQTNLLAMIAAVGVGGVLWLLTLARQRHPLFDELTRVLARFRPAAPVHEG